MTIHGKIVKIRPSLQEGRLKIVARVKSDEGRTLDVYIPDREASALIPRHVLIGDGTKAPRALLSTIGAILRRSVQGRKLKIWQFEDRYYGSFHSWRSVKFEESRTK